MLGIGIIFQIENTVTIKTFSSNLLYFATGWYLNASWMAKESFFTFHLRTLPLLYLFLIFLIILPQCFASV